MRKQLSLHNCKHERLVRKYDGQTGTSADMLLLGENLGVSYAVFEYKKKFLVRLDASILQ